MTKRSENQKIKAKEREWDEILRPFDKWIDGIRREVKHDFKHMIDFMMYFKKPKDRVDKFVHSVEWWGIIIGIFFALKGITDYFAGR